MLILLLIMSCASSHNISVIHCYFSIVLLFSCCTMTAADEVQKSFDQNLSLPCNGCDHSQDCYGVINGNITNRGSLITQNGSILLRSHTWNVYGSVCCGSNLEQLLCRTVCPRYG